MCHYRILYRMNDGVNVTSKTKITQDPERKALLSQVRPFKSIPAVGERNGRTGSSKALVAHGGEGAQDGHPLREADSQGPSVPSSPGPPQSRASLPLPLISPYCNCVFTCLSLPLQMRGQVSLRPFWPELVCPALKQFIFLE